MSTTLFEYEGSSILPWQDGFSQAFSKEIYAGEFGIRGSAEGGSLLLERGPTLPVPIYAVHSTVAMTLRRTYRHTRESKQHFYIVWILDEGEVSLSSASGTRLIDKRSIVLIDSRSPFFIKVLGGADGEHRNLFALIPPHMFHGSIRSDRNMNTVHCSSGSPHGHVVAQLFRLLYASGDTLSEPIAIALLRTALDALGKLAIDHDAGQRRDRALIGERFRQIESCITLHLGDPAFGLREAATLCNISTRHVSAIMRKHGTSFATMLRKSRAELANTLLKSADMRQLTIAEIAKISGFRRGAELSRVFSDIYGVTPRQARQNAAA